MQRHSKSNSGPISEAKLAANRRNAQRSTGPSPSGTQRTRFNALKDGLTARMAWAGQDPQRDQEFSNRAWARLGPRNVAEELGVRDLLLTRLRDSWLLDAERAVLTRRHVLQVPDDDPYPFLGNPDGMDALIPLTRHLVHFTRIFDKELAELLNARKKRQGARANGRAVVAPPGKSRTAKSGAQVLGEATRQPETADAPGTLPGLAAFLSDRRRVLPGEDASALESLARALWTAYQPANLLEEFVVADLVDAQWRLDRAIHLQALLLRRSAIADSGQDCGLGFGFVHDCQQAQGLEVLRTYECGLRKRLDRRRALWRKLRKQGWHDATAAAPQPAPELPARPVTDAAPAVSPAAMPPASPLTSDTMAMPEAAPPAGSERPPANPDKASLGPPAPGTNVNPTGPE